MAQPTGQSYHYLGPAVIYTGSGTSGAGETLGVSEDGVDIRLEEIYEDIKSDAAGGETAERRSLNKRAKIRARLVAFDYAVLQRCLSRGDRTTAGMLNSPGVLLHTNSYGFKVGITGGSNGVNNDDPWYFPFCTMSAEPVGTKLGSKSSLWDVVFDAMGFVPGTATTAKDIVLWARAFPGGFPS